MPDQELLLPSRRSIHPGAQRWLILLILAALTFSARDHADSYVFRDGDVTYMFGDGMSARALKAIQKQNGAQFLWWRGPRTYVSHDPATMEKARTIVQRNESRREQQRAIAALMSAALAGGKACPID